MDDLIKRQRFRNRRGRGLTTARSWILNDGSPQLPPKANRVAQKIYTLLPWEEPLPPAPSLYPTGPHNSEVLGVLTCEPPHLWELLWPPFEMSIIYYLK